jgi:catalase
MEQMKRSFKQIGQGVFVIVMMVAGRARGVAEEQEVGVEVKPVRAEKLATAPGQTLTAVTVNYAPGARSSAHQHSGSVFAYVLTGSIRSENSATGPVRIYQAGESFFEPAGSKHLVSENASATEPASLLAVFVANDGAELTAFTAASTHALSERELAHEILETMLRVQGNQPGHRTVHAKGLVCAGTFEPARDAAALSKAAHFQGKPVPIVVRLSEGAPDPAVSDNSPNAGPRGVAIRFKLPDGSETDIVAMSHNGFVVGTGEEFLALQQAIAAIDPDKPHPWDIEKFLSSHPLAMKFVQENKIVPVSLANEAFFANDAFIFVNKEGVKQPGRYKIFPMAGQQHLTEDEAKSKPVNFLMDDMKARLAGGMVKYRVIVQLPNADDSTKDPSLVWPDDRKTIELGTISLTSVDPNSATAENDLAFDPTNLTDGIELSDDTLPALRARVYSLASHHRQQQAGGSPPTKK